jgi:hypothetical protein
MPRNALLAAVLTLAVAAPAAGQLAKGRGAPLKEAEAKAALFGIDMQGYSPTYGFSWRECIEPTGKTLYETPDRTSQGRLEISLDGRACFSYEDDNYEYQGCYMTYRTATGALRFEGEAKELFVTTRVVTGVTTCERQLIG